MKYKIIDRRFECNDYLICKLFIEDDPFANSYPEPEMIVTDRTTIEDIVNDRKKYFEHVFPVKTDIREMNLYEISNELYLSQDMFDNSIQSATTLTTYVECIISKSGKPVFHIPTINKKVLENLQWRIKSHRLFHL